MRQETTFDAEAVVRLRRAIVRLARSFNASAASEDLSPSQASVLAVVGARGPLGLAELSRVEGINPTMLSRIVTKLDGQGLIQRRADPADQRAALIEATDSGRRTSERIREARSTAVTRILDRLPGETSASLLEALPALEALADGLGGGATGHAPS
jgi:DNA-binding MarR family transcriptional regulator